MFIAKYDSDGALAWVKPGRSAGGGRYSWGVRGNAIAVDSLGHSYVTGEFSATAIFGSGEPNRTELTAIYGFPDTTDIFIVKYSTSGVVQWARQAGGAFYDHGNAIAVDGSGNSYIWGTYSVSAIFGTGEANETTLRSGFVRTGFVAKYNTSGWLQWAKKTGATGGGPVDFDEDGKSDVAIYRNGAWSVQRSWDGLNDVKGFGGAGWLAVPADYDGDGKSDVAIYKDGEWYWVRSSDGVNAKLGWGGVDWEPVPGDYDGDGMADIAVYHAASGSWSIVRTSDGANEVAHLGGADWLAVPADYDGDGRADLAVYLGGTWAIQRSSDGGVTLTGHGGPGWVPVPGDYDGDGKADIAVYMNGAWSILRSSDNVITVVGHGGPDWVPVPGDYDGDGKTDVAVYHPIGAWSIKRSSDGAIQVVGHGGGPQDVPLN